MHGYAKSYEHNLCPTLSRMAVTKVTTKTLTDLYGAHQARGLAPRTVYQIHACLSSMFTQACRWGWRDLNPARWAEPPSRPNTAPVVATPAEIRALIDAAEQSRRPEYARAILVAALDNITGIRAVLVWDRRTRAVKASARIGRPDRHFGSAADRHRYNDHRVAPRPP